MGQRIVVQEPVVVGDVAIFETDRSLTGMAGEALASPDAAEEASGFGAELARRLYAADDDLARVYVSSNTVVARREGGWADGPLQTASRVVEEFFLYY
jgi:hypothetical protein